MPASIVELVDSTGIVQAEATTDGNGNYLFTGVPVGDHTVRVVPSTLASNTVQTADPDAVFDDSATLTMTAGGSITTIDFGYQLLGSLGDTIFRDDNGNGTQDSGEPGLAGIDVDLLDSTGNLITTETTDGGGNYVFAGLAPGTYSARVVTSTLPVNTQQITGNPDPTLDGQSQVSLLAGARSTASTSATSRSASSATPSSPMTRQRYPRRR